MKKILLLLITFYLAGCEFAVDDQTPPTIEVLGGDTENGNRVSINLSYGDNPIVDYYTSMESVIVSDNMEGVITSEVLINEGLIKSIDTTRIGSYTIKYRARDEDSNGAEVTRVLEVKDTQAPILIVTDIHGGDLDGRPVSGDATSINFPINTPFNPKLMLLGLKYKDVHYIKDGIESINPVETTQIIEIQSLPEEFNSEGALIFKNSGEYEVKFTIKDNADNSTADTRKIIVSQDSNPPLMDPPPPLIIHPLIGALVPAVEEVVDENGNITTEAVPEHFKIQQSLKDQLLIDLTTIDISLEDDFFPYSEFDGIGGAEPEINQTNILVKIVKNGILEENFNDTILSTATPPEGVEIPMVVTDLAGNTSALIKRRLIVLDQNPPILNSFKKTHPLEIEVDALLTKSEIITKILTLSSLKDDLDNLVTFVDQELEVVEALIQSEIDNSNYTVYELRDNFGNEILRNDNSLNHTLVSSGPFTVTYDAFDKVNYSSTPPEERTKEIIFIDTTPPVINLLKFIENSTKESERFISFLRTSPGFLINDKKEFLVSGGDLEITDNGVIDYMDLTLGAIVTVTSNPACQAVGEEILLECDGEHTIILSVTDRNNITSEVPYPVNVYVYGEASKQAFDSILGETADGYSEFLLSGATYHLNTGGDDNLGIDPKVLKEYIESKIKDVVIMDSDDAGYLERFKYEIPSELKNQKVKIGETILDFSMDFKNTDGEYVSYYNHIDAEEFLYFNRPGPSTKIKNIDGIYLKPEKFITEIKIKLKVGSYAKQIIIPVEIKPYSNSNEFYNFVLAVHPKYTVGTTTDEDVSLVSNDLDRVSDFYHKNVIQPTNEFLNTSTRGLYLSNSSILTPNENVYKSGVSILEANNRYLFIDAVQTEHLINESGVLKKEYQTQIKDYLQDLILGNDLLSERLLISGANGNISSRELKALIVVLDPELDRDPVIMPAIINFTDSTLVQQWDKLPENEYPSINTCIDGELYTRMVRGYEILGSVYCNIEEAPFISEETRTGTTDGEFAHSNDQIYIWVSFDQTTQEVDELGEITEVVTPVQSWCNYVTDPNCQSLANGGSLDDGEYDILIEYEIPSFLYEKGLEVDSPMQNILINKTGGYYPHDDEVISMNWYNQMEIDNGLAKVVKITKGEIMSKFILNTLMKKVGKASYMIGSVDDNTPDLIIQPPTEKYTLGKDNKLAFFAGGAFLRETDSAGNIISGQKLGDTFSAMSAYDKYISSSVEPKELSLYRMVNDQKIYKIKMNTQYLNAGNEAFNQNILKINISTDEDEDGIPGLDALPGQNEYFLIELRQKGDYDYIKSFGNKVAEMEWNTYDENGDITGLLAADKRVMEYRDIELDDKVIMVWHVEEEQGNIKVAKESASYNFFGEGYRLEPSSDKSPGNEETTDTNDNRRSGLLIKVIHEDVAKTDEEISRLEEENGEANLTEEEKFTKEIFIKVCHKSAGDIDLDCKI